MPFCQLSAPQNLHTQLPTCLSLSPNAADLSPPAAAVTGRLARVPASGHFLCFPLCQTQTLTVLRRELHRERLDQRSWHDIRPSRCGQSDVLLTSPSAVSDTKERAIRTGHPPSSGRLLSRPALLRRCRPSSLGDPCGCLSCLHSIFPSPSLHLCPPFIVQLAGR